jgi:hypothetical protein
MPTLKRKNANGQWEYIQVSGLDVSQLKDEVDSNATALAESTKKADVAEVNVESFRTTGLSDADTVINAIAGSVGKKLKFPFNQTYVMTKKLRIPCGNTQIDLNGSKLDFSGFSGTTAVELVPGTSNKLLTALSNGIILGSNVTSNNTDGIFIGLPSDMTTGATAHFSLENLTIDGFRDNIVFGSQSWCNTIREVLNIHFWRYGVNFNTVTNAGENIRFFGGTFANGKLGATAVYTGANINPDVYFHSTSFDYTDYFFNVSGGHYNLFGCHLENNNNKPMIKVTFTGGNSPINFAVFGGAMGVGPGTDTSSPESVSGRPWYVELSGDKIAFSMDSVDSYLYDKSSELVHVVSGVPQVSIRSPHLSPKGGNPPDICNATNQLWNGDFESSTAFQGWNTSVGTGSLTLDSTTFYSGTKSANFTVASGTSGGSIYQDITGLTAGRILMFSGYFKSNITVGYMSIRLQSYNVKGDLVNDWIMDALTGCYISGVTDWKRIGLGYTIPAGVSKITMQIYFNGITGTCWADKMQAWVV